MCGIVGIVGTKVQEQDLHVCLSKLAHRGPDDKGIYLGNQFGLGHHRLAIIDTTSAAHQPMISANGKWVMVYNGELYNHLDLRKRHFPADFRFRTHSDTETLIELWSLKGASILKELNGMFAFAVTEMATGRTYLARDRHGIKPLYYKFEDSVLRFASEAKCLYRSDRHSQALEVNALYQYASLLWCATPNTPDASVRKLPIGNLLVWEEGTMKCSSYLPAQPLQHYEQKTSLDGLKQLLIKSVEEHLLADVPIGLMLSGGLDSSLLLAMLYKELGIKNIPCYTVDAGIGYEQEGFGDDLPFAKFMAQQCEAQLHIIKAKPFDWQAFDHMIWHLDEPQADVAPLLLKAMAEQAQQDGLKVLWSGMGADELFAGYRRHQALRFYKLLRAFPTSAKNVANVIPEKKFRRRAQKLLQASHSDVQSFVSNLFYWLPQSEVLQLFSNQARDKIKADEFRMLTKKCLGKQEGDLLRSVLCLDQEIYLPAHNLNYADKLSMAHGVEVRVPYLDNDLVSFTKNLSAKQLMHAGQGKYWLKKIAAGYLPKELLNRKKTGLGAPLRYWIQTDIRFAEEMKQRLMLTIKENEALFDAKAVLQLFEDTQSGKRDGAYTLLAICAIGSWLRQFYHQQPAA